MGSIRIDNVLHLLGSERIKDRQEGLSSLRLWSDREDNIIAVDGDNWNMIFVALFGAFKTEFDLCKKNGSIPADATGSNATAIRRLSDVASALRWLTDRSVTRLNTKAAKHLLRTIRSEIIYANKLLTPVALDFLKAIRCVIGWRPHLDHMNKAEWMAIARLAFNIVLGDPPTTKWKEAVAGADYEEKPGVPRKRRRQSPDPEQVDARIGSPSFDVAQSQPVSLEQIECMSILAILLRSSSAPLLPLKDDKNDDKGDDNALAVSILDRLERFIQIFPIDTTLHHDYVICLSAVLSHIALNQRGLVSNFAKTVWPGLVGMWSAKKQAMKESLIVVMKLLFPFLLDDGDDPARMDNAEYVTGVIKLWLLLDGEAESRWGVNGLSLDSLRLEVISSQQGQAVDGAFVANTFRYGWHFNSTQALSWAILELQADCTKKLYLLSESMPLSPSIGRKGEGKRLKLEVKNPIPSLLRSIRTQVTPSIRIYHIQILLFFVDKHWSILHDELKQEVISTLFRFVSFENDQVQSWAFLCLAAIAHASSTSDLSLLHTSLTRSHSGDSALWDPMWTHVMRRTSVPATSRAACHAAYVLLVHAKQLLTPQRVLSEIETLATDLDVQGPLFPYDSVCALLCLCLRVASEDVRLYRMQLEEKVLAWLMDAWRVDKGNRLKMPLHTTGDVLMLLESICLLRRRSDLLYPIPLPQSSVVEAVVEDKRTAVIRDFLLHAYLPPFRRPSNHCPGTISIHADTNLREPARDDGLLTEAVDTRDLSQPRGRERRLSGFFLKSLEELAADWLINKDTTGYLTAEKVRSSVDFSVLALCFEATLVSNGTLSNRRVIKASCRLIGILAPLIPHKRWTSEERALIISGFQPLVLAHDGDSDFVNWETLLPPSTGTGIRRSVLRSLAQVSTGPDQDGSAARRNIQQVIFQSTDVQDVFIHVLEALRNVLCLATGLSTDIHSPLQSTNNNKDEDGFGPVRVHQDAGREATAADGNSVNRLSVDICMTTLAVVPILQSHSSDPTRDKDLTDLMLKCDDDDFLFLAPSYLKNIRRRTFYLSQSNLDDIMERCGELLKTHTYSRDERLQSLVIQLLDATINLWLQTPVAMGETGGNVRTLYAWISREPLTIRSWRIRDHFVRFLDSYLEQDPMQEMFTVPPTRADKDWGPDRYPLALLPTLLKDGDIRVRFRAAVAIPRLFVLPRSDEQRPDALYRGIHSQLCRMLDEYEDMLTRFLCLGNIMIVSSAMRRGPYWHLLETCLFTSSYTRHVETVLVGVSERMGLARFSELFESYASQIAFSIREVEKDFLLLPPHILGYRDRKECASVAFHAFTPSNLLGPGTHSSNEHGYNLFINHCKAIQKSSTDGIRECFADIVGLQLVTWISDHPSNIDISPDELDTMLKVRTKQADLGKPFVQCLTDNIDAIVVVILRTLFEEQDCRIVKGLQSFGCSEDTVRTFEELIQHRVDSEFEVHEPNLPRFGVDTVIQALVWLSSWVPEASTPATSYHVLHQLFYDIEHSPIVNEQMRLLNEICFWIAFHSRHFEDYTLLRTVVNGATTVLMQSDLAGAAQSVLAWSFGRLRKRNQKDDRLADTFIRISHQAYDYAHDQQDPSIARMGRELMQWIEKEALEVSKCKMFKSQVVKALSAWPQELPQELKSLCENIRPSDLSNVLNDHRIAGNKFRLVRRLRDLAIDGRCVPHNFSKSDFWRLKECIPSTAQMLDDDVDAFATLLHSNHGQIDSIGSELSVLETVRSRHCNAVRRKVGPVPGDVARRAIVVSLLTMLGATSAIQVYVSYRTLRSLMSAYTPESLAESSWPTEYSVELRLLQAHSTPVSARTHCNLGDLLTSEQALESTEVFSKWITFITVALCDVLALIDPFYVPFAPILQSDVVFAEQLLPVLVHTLLHHELSQPSPLSDGPCRSFLSIYFTAVLTCDSADVACLRAVVDIALHLRFFEPARSTDALANEKWLDVDYVLLSQSAIKCGAYTTALLFLELAVKFRDAAATVEDILFNIYSHIDEPDGFYGIQTQDLHRFLIRRLHHEKQWDKAFRFHGAALEAGTSDMGHAEGIVEALHSFGFNSLAINTVERRSSGVNARANSDAMMYNLGWRTETWDLPERSFESNSGAPLYLALRAIYRERSDRVVDGMIRQALTDEMTRLHHLGAENFLEVRQVVQNLMCIHQVKQWRSQRVQAMLQSKHVDPASWATFTSVDSHFDFPDIEAIMATRISLIRSVRLKEQREQIGDLISPFCRGLIDLEARCLIHISEAARHAHCSQVALNSVTRALELLKTPTSEAANEYADVLWLMKEPKIAVDLLANDKLLSEVYDSQPADIVAQRTQKALLQARLGTWSAEANLGKPKDIAQKYFQPASEQLSKQSPAILKNYDVVCATVYHQYAVFAERQYHAIVASPDALRWRVYVDRKMQEVDARQMQVKEERVPNHAIALKQATKLLEQDRAQFQDHLDTRKQFLNVAVEMYSRCLEASEVFDDDSAIRLCSLWLANFDDTSDLEDFGSVLQRIPSHKFVFLAHQLAARLAKPQSSQTSDNQANLQALFTRICQEHPFHSLFQVYCLISEQTDPTSARRQSSRLESPSAQVERVAAAADIFNRLRDSSKANCIRDVEQVCRASLEWAKFPIKAKHKSRPKGELQIPDHLLIRNVRGLHVPVITVHTPIDPTTQYQDCVWIDCYEPTYTTAGGVNLPKITKCLGTNGQKYRQLFKGEGNDDLRQDAVMEQVFDLVNVVLCHDRETARRKLGIRGYKVIPLASQAGVLEFVDHTTPLQTWLPPAHTHYHPNDISVKKFAMEMNKVREECKNAREPETAPLVETFLKLRERFKPVMKYYFTEKYKTPMSWFAMRLNYSRSVATTSVVGHVLGLGDRHTSNILMDNITGEVVHIDLGIAFDQGKLLPVPERVPFRLTADMVDGLGLSKTQGVFQRCAEETLRVLRDRSEVILTVLEVFRYDPLHSWTASELKLKRVQQRDKTAQLTDEAVRYAIGIGIGSGTADEAADRALQSVSRKLEKTLSVEYTVNDLVTTATDITNLATMYFGWSPHL